MKTLGIKSHPTIVGSLFLPTWIWSTL